MLQHYTYNNCWAVSSTQPPYMGLVSGVRVLSKFLVHDSTARGHTFIKLMNICTVLYKTYVQPIGRLLNMTQYKLYKIWDIDQKPVLDVRLEKVVQSDKLAKYTTSYVQLNLQELRVWLQT